MSERNTDESVDAGDREKLKVFLDDLEELLDDLAEAPRPAIPGRLRKAFADAWKLTKARFKYVRNALPTRDWDPQLIDRGLSGDSLRFKLAVFYQALHELLDHGKATEGKPEDLAWWKTWRRLFRLVLKAGTVILGSTASEIPGSEYIKEFLQSLGIALEVLE